MSIASCDRIIPGIILSALRLNRPFIFIGGGQMLPCDYAGERMGFVSAVMKASRAPSTRASISSMMLASQGTCGGTYLNTGIPLALEADSASLAKPILVNTATGFFLSSMDTVSYTRYLVQAPQSP